MTQKFYQNNKHAVSDWKSYKTLINVHSTMNNLANLINWWTTAGHCTETASASLKKSSLIKKSVKIRLENSYTVLNWNGSTPCARKRHKVSRSYKCNKKKKQSTKCQFMHIKGNRQQWCYWRMRRNTTKMKVQNDYRNLRRIEVLCKWSNYIVEWNKTLIWHWVPKKIFHIWGGRKNFKSNKV